MTKNHASKDARTQLLEAGATLFAEKGYKGASIREICDQAGTGNNMIHHYFGSKQGLYAAIISQFTSEVFTVPIRIMQKLPDTQAEFISRFELFVEETLEAMISNRFLFAMILQEEMQPEESPFIAYTSNFVSFIDHGKKKGFVNESIDPSMLTGFILDRLSNQVLHAKTIKQSAGSDVASDTDYKDRWLRANLNLLLHGFLA